MFKLKKALLALSIFCIPTFAFGDVPSYENIPDEFYQFYSCMTFAEKLDEYDNPIYDDDTDKIVQYATWKTGPCTVTIEGTSLPGTCQLTSKPSDHIIYTKYNYFLLKGKPMETPKTNNIYHCEVPGYTIDKNGTYVKNDGDEGTQPETPADSAFTDIDNIFQNNSLFTKSSVWTDDDGGFNTARLVSDSVAGVVLGTVGGVVTSKIIKKNQLKKGMETFRCTIAGQDVASMGDEFNVSVQ